MPAPGAAAKLKFGTVTEDYEQADLRAEIEALTAEVTRLSGLLVLCDPVLGT